MNKKTKKIVSVVLGTALMSATMIGCANSSKSGHSDVGNKNMKHASCGANGCGSTHK